MTDLQFAKLMGGYFGCVAVGLLIVFVIGLQIERSMKGRWLWQKTPNAGDVRRVKKWIFNAKTFEGITKSWCRAEVVQMWSAGGMMSMYSYALPEWITLGWGEFIESVSHTEPKYSIVSPTNAPQAQIIIKKKESGAIVWGERKT